jgi:hypothetical protein
LLWFPALPTPETTRVSRRPETRLVGRTGREHLANSSETAQVSRAPEAKGEAVGQQNPPADPDLARVMEAWPALPPALKAGIVAMVKASAGG